MLVADSVGRPELPVTEVARAGGPQAEMGYRWGHSPPWEIPSTVRRLLELARWTPSVRDPPTWRNDRRAVVVAPWLPLWGLWTGAALLGLVRRPWRLTAFAVLLVPFAVALENAWTLQTTMRFLMLGSPVVAVAAGVGTRWLASWFPRRLALPLPLPPTVAAALVGFPLASGFVPTCLSHGLPWSRPFETQQDLLELLERARTEGTRARASSGPEATCLGALAEDRLAGRPLLDQVLPRCPSRWPGPPRGPNRCREP